MALLLYILSLNVTNWENNANTKIIELEESITAQYVKFVTTENWDDGRSFTSAAMINLFEDLTKNEIPTVLIHLQKMGNLFLSLLINMETEENNQKPSEDNIHKPGEDNNQKPNENNNQESNEDNNQKTEEKNNQKTEEGNTQKPEEDNTIFKEILPHTGVDYGIIIKAIVIFVVIILINIIFWIRRKM